MKVREVWSRWRITILLCVTALLWLSALAWATISPIETKGMVPAALAGAGILLMLIFMPRYQVASILYAQDRLVAENEHRRTIAMTLSSAALIVAGYLAWRDATQRAEQANQQMQLERFTRAVSQLASVESQTVRLAGIVALERVALADWRETISVSRILSAFLRERKLGSEHPDMSHWTFVSSVDFQCTPIPKATPLVEVDEALRALRVVSAARAKGLAAQDPTEAPPDDIAEPEDLLRIFQGVTREEIARERRARKTRRLTPEEISRAGRAGISLANAPLQFSDLERQDISGTDATNVNMVGVRARGMRAHKTELANAHLQWAELNGASFHEANLTTASLLCARSDDVTFSFAEMGGADLRGASFSHVDFRGAKLGGADLRTASFGKSVWEGAVLQGADLRGASIFDAYGLTQAQVDAACSDASTALPGTTHGKGPPLKHGSGKNCPGPGNSLPLPGFPN